MKELDPPGAFSEKIQELAGAHLDLEAWEGTKYHPNRQNYKDRIVSLAEEIASEIVWMMKEKGLIRNRGQYLEQYVNEIWVKR